MAGWHDRGSGSDGNKRMERDDMKKGSMETDLEEAKAHRGL
jgi:hypothetical protein